MKKKKILFLLLMSMTCSMLFACGSKDTQKETGKQNEEAEETETYALGQTVSTDIFELTLNKADLTIALENRIGNEYFIPKEYDAADDAKNPYVASKGHTLAAFTYTAANLDRGSVNVDESFNPTFLTIEYNGETYHSDTIYGARSTDGLNWERNNSSNVLLLASDSAMYRAYVDIPIEIENLSDTFTMIFSLPNSDGTTTDFTYTITSEAREEAQNQKIELTLEQAKDNFTKDEGQAYFKDHVSEYTSVSGDEIESVVLSKAWDVVYLPPEYSGFLEGTFWFEDNGVIKDTYGYANERTWAVKEDSLILNGKYEREMKEVTDGLYLLLLEGEPYMLMD